ncbi:MAG: hypothetical protein ACTSR3_12700 [Candidatus Helarchaeota archaeon]
MFNKGNYWNLIDIKGDGIDFPYLHGIEMEYFLLDNNFEPVNDNELLEKIVKNNYRQFDELFKQNSMIKNKIVSFDLERKEDLRMRVSDEEAYKKICTISIRYKQKKYNLISELIDIVGKDTHFGNFITLELVTPPCDSIIELKWWLFALLKVTHESCKKFGLNFLNLASHPKIPSNFCGEHHHIGIPNKNQRLKIYNVMRYFLPLLSIISYNSFPPVLPIKLDFDKRIQDIRFSNQIIRSYRLKNTQQIKPVPPIENFYLDDFAKKSGLDINTSRMVDLYPFTKYDSLEVRIFDTQISISRTLSIAILLQAICQFALGLDDKLIKLLNRVIDIRYYNNIRLNLIKTGFITPQKPRQIYLNIQKEIEALCYFCKNNKNCDKKNLEKLSCNFEAENSIDHNLISLLFFPRRFKGYNQIEHQKINAKLQLELLLKILEPHLSSMRISHNVSLRSLEASIKLKIEPSMYNLYLFFKLNSNLKEFCKTYLKIKEKMLNKEEKWGEYYDPLLEIET